MSIYKCKSSSRSSSTIHILAAMEAPHKAHHKPSAGAKHAKKDAAKGVDRSGGKNFNPKVRTYPPAPAHPSLTVRRHSQTPPSEQPIEQPGVLPRRTSSVSMYPWLTATLRNARSLMKKAKEWTKVPCHLRPSLSALLALLVWERLLCCDLLLEGSRSTTSPSRRVL